MRSAVAQNCFTALNNAIKVNKRDLSKQKLHYLKRCIITCLFCCWIVRRTRKKRKSKQVSNCLQFGLQWTQSSYLLAFVWSGWRRRLLLQNALFQVKDETFAVVLNTCFVNLLCKQSWRRLEIFISKIFLVKLTKCLLRLSFENLLTESFPLL